MEELSLGIWCRRWQNRLMFTIIRILFDNSALSRLGPIGFYEVYILSDILNIKRMRCVVIDVWERALWYKPMNKEMHVHDVNVFITIACLSVVLTLCGPPNTTASRSATGWSRFCHFCSVNEIFSILTLEWLMPMLYTCKCQLAYYNLPTKPETKDSICRVSNTLMF